MLLVLSEGNWNGCAKAQHGYPCFNLFNSGSNSGKGNGELAFCVSRNTSLLCKRLPLRSRQSFSTSVPEMRGNKKALSSGGQGRRGRIKLSTTKW